MQTVKDTREKNNAQFVGRIAPSRFCQRIGSTVFTVNIYFKEDGKETLEDKMYRMMQSDLYSERLCGNIKEPQADALPERGSV